MAKYRKKKDDSSDPMAALQADSIYAWHWCFNCPSWPEDNYQEMEAKPDNNLCDECMALQRVHQCTNATTEFIVPPKTPNLIR